MNLIFKFFPRAVLLVCTFLCASSGANAQTPMVGNERIQLQVLSKFPVLKIQAIKEALQVQLPQVKLLKERGIASGVYTYEGSFSGLPEQLKKPLEAFTFEAMPVKSVEIDGRTLEIHF